MMMPPASFGALLSLPQHDAEGRSRRSDSKRYSRSISSRDAAAELKAPQCAPLRLSFSQQLNTRELPTISRQPPPLRLLLLLYQTTAPGPYARPPPLAIHRKPCSLQQQAPGHDANSYHTGAAIFRHLAAISPYHFSRIVHMRTRRSERERLAAQLKRRSRREIIDSRHIARVTLSPFSLSRSSIIDDYDILRKTDSLMPSLYLFYFVIRLQPIYFIPCRLVEESLILLNNMMTPAPTIPRARVAPRQARGRYRHCRNAASLLAQVSHDARRRHIFTREKEHAERQPPPSPPEARDGMEVADASSRRQPTTTTPTADD